MGKQTWDVRHPGEKVDLTNTIPCSRAKAIALMTPLGYWRGDGLSYKAWCLLNIRMSFSAWESWLLAQLLQGANEE